MSNDQPSAQPLYTPIILHLSPQTQQQEATYQFLQDKYDWKLKPEDLNLKIINQEQTSISIETIRELIGELGYAARSKQPRIILLLAANQLTPAAQHAFLKSLEEPPANTLIVLATNNPNQLLGTIRSRCILHQLKTEPSNTSSFEELDQKIPALIKKLIQNRGEVTYHQIIELVAEHKSKDQAIKLVNLLIRWLHHQPQTTQKIIYLQQKLVETITHLQGNVNPSLALEEVLFRIKNQRLKKK